MAPRVVIIDCQDLALRGLKDPYTGKPQTFKMVLSGSGEPRVFSPDAFSPTQTFATSQEAFLALHMRDGMAGAVGDREPVVCAYTGEPLFLTSSDDGYYWSGGFDPTLPIYNATDFINKVRMRKGVLEGDERAKAPDAFVSEGGVVEMPEAVHLGPTDISRETEDTLRKIVDGMPGPTPTVPRSGARKPRSKRV